MKYTMQRLLEMRAHTLAYGVGPRQKTQVLELLDEVISLYPPQLINVQVRLHGSENVTAITLPVTKEEYDFLINLAQILKDAAKTKGFSPVMELAREGDSDYFTWYETGE